MKKRLLSIILAVVLASGTIPTMTVPVHAEDATPPTTQTATSGQCGYNANWALSDDGLLSITGSGSLHLTNVPWENLRFSIKEVKISNDITDIPNGAFYNCGNLEKVTLSNSLTEIPGRCFEECNSLKSVTIPNNVKYIENFAFEGCSSLKSIDIPDNVNRLGYCVFSDCTSLENVTLSNSISTIDGSAFKRCTSLTNINIPNSIESIDNSAFAYCDKLSTLDLSNTSLNEIGDSAFDKCTSLSSISLPYTLKHVGQSAFSYCDNLKDITFNGTPRQFNSINIENDNDAITFPKKKYIYTKATTLSLPKTLTINSQNMPWDATLLSATVASDATDPYVEWSLSPSDIVEIERDNNNSDTSILIRPLKEGIATITAKTQDGSNLSATCTVTVTSPENYATVYFENTNIQPQSVKKGEKISKPDDPQKDGYTFSGWSISNSGKLFDFTQPITDDYLYLKPVWQKNTVDVTLRADCLGEYYGASKVYPTQSVDRNAIFSQPEAPIFKGYSFVKWYVSYTDKNGKWAQYNYDFSKSVDDNINTIRALSNSDYFNNDRLELTAEMSQNPITVTYHLNGVVGKDVLTTKDAKYNGDIDREIYPAVPGYAFLGWYTDKNCTTKEIDWTNVTKNVDLYAGWLKFADYSNSTSAQTEIKKVDDTTIVTPKSDNGTTSVTEGKDKGKASITTNPSSGYETDKIRVIGEDGKEIPVKKIGDNTYSFNTPKGNAAVIATYKAKEMPFSDISANAYYYKPVQWALKNGITSGTSATAFSPSKPCKRSEMVTFLWRMAGSPKVSGNIQFNDIPNNAYYKDALLWAVQNGITSGKTSNTFAPNEPCNRGQMATFLWRMKGKPESSESTFEDVKSTDYYSTAISWLKSSGITAGKTQTSFDPNGDCTRGQMVTFLYRYSGNK